MTPIEQTIHRLKVQIHEKTKIIDENVSMGGWNDEWRAKEYKELNTFYDALHTLLNLEEKAK